MHHAVVRGVELFALIILGGEDGDAAIVLVPAHVTRAVTEADLPTTVVKGIAVAIHGRRAEHPTDMVVLFEVAQVLVAWDVAPHEIATRAVPGAALGPECASIEALDWCIAKLVLEPLVEGDDVWIRISLWLDVGAKIPRKRCRGHHRHGSEASSPLQKTAAHQRPGICLLCKTFCFVQPLFHRESSNIGITDAQKALRELREGRAVLGAVHYCGMMQVDK